MRMRFVLLLLPLVRLVPLVTLVVIGASSGCGGAESGSPTQPVEDGSTFDASSDASSDVPIDGIADSFADAITTDSATSEGGPPAPRRLPCVDRSELATNLPLDVFGALEGELVSIVLPGTKFCAADVDHLHLQIDVTGQRYDVAITIDSSTGGTPIALTAKDIAATTAVPGWSGTGFDFATNLGVPSADFTPMTKAELLARLQSELATVSLVSIHGHSYTDGTGVHNVHRNGGGHDGVILVRRAGVGGTDHAIALRFSTDVF